MHFELAQSALQDVGQAGGNASLPGVHLFNPARKLDQLRQLAPVDLMLALQNVIDQLAGIRR
jgi:hypothetical protein